jgi:hypothetical protein
MDISFIKHTDNNTFDDIDLKAPDSHARQKSYLVGDYNA